MRDSSEVVSEFFRGFEEYSETGDPRVASMFAEMFMMADPSGARVVTAGQLATAIPQRKKLFQSAGSRGSTLESLEQTDLGDHYVLVKTKWRMQFDRPDARIEYVIVQSTFIVHRAGETMTIVFYLPHQDIMAVLRERGIL